MEMSTRNLVQKIFILLLVLAFATFTKGKSKKDYACAMPYCPYLFFNVAQNFLLSSDPYSVYHSMVSFLILSIENPDHLPLNSIECSRVHACSLID